MCEKLELQQVYNVKTRDDILMAMKLAEFIDRGNEI